MKILFVYNHEGHAEPILRSRVAFPMRDATLTAVEVGNDQDAQNVVAAHEFDVLLLQEPPVFESVLDCGRPVILYERIDGAQLRAARSYLDRVAGVVKGYCFYPAERNNQWYDRGHVHALARCGITAREPRHRNELPQPQVNPADLENVYAGPGFGSFGRMETCIKTVVDFDASRRYDCHFTGTLDYEASEIETHRLLALQILQRYEAQFPGRAFGADGRTAPYQSYLLSMLRSKTVLCPWGWGEATHRDYEAMALGAVVIKPDTSYVAAWPNIYQPEKTYVPCKCDFSDAVEKIEHVRDHWEDYRSMRELARDTVLKAWDLEQIAGRIVWCIKQILGAVTC
ncbi:MAG TPA: glycosyltransferase [Acidobacteriota bacterium]|nr:glycosyltransferase [Acidobacteriota bacterium]